MPARLAQRIAPFAGKALRRLVQASQRRARRPRLRGRGFGNADPGQEFDEAGGAPGKLLQPPAIAIGDEARHAAPARAQMIEQVHEKGQVGLIHPLFIQRQYIALPAAGLTVRPGGFQQIIAVLHAFGDALGRH